MNNQSGIKFPDSERIKKLAKEYGFKLSTVMDTDNKSVEFDFSEGMEKMKSEVLRLNEVKTEIVCMCGSTKFSDLMAVISWEFEKKGKIVLRVNYVPDWYGRMMNHSENTHFADQEGLKKELDELHFRKIDMCDKVYVCNYNGYIGESTRNEINYAVKVGKPVLYMEDAEGNEMSETVSKIIGWLEDSNNFPKEVKTKEWAINKWELILKSDSHNNIDHYGRKVLQEMFDDFHNQFSCQSQGGFTEKDMEEFAEFSTEDYGATFTAESKTKSWFDLNGNKFTTHELLQLYLKDK